MIRGTKAFDMKEASAAQREAALEIQRDRGQEGQPLGSIWSSMMDSPQAARRVARVGAHCRFDSALTPAEREIAILAAAYALGFEYECRYHEQFAPAQGVPAAHITALKEDRPEALPARLSDIAHLARSVARGDDAHAALQAARASLGEQAATDVVVTAGYYAMLQRISDTLLPPPGG